MTKNIDITKNYTTRDGMKVRLLATDVNHSNYPVLGLIMNKDAEDFVWQWTAAGRCYGDQPHQNDLIEFIETITYSPVFYDGWIGSNYDSKESFIPTLGVRNLSGCIKMTMVNQKVTSVELV